MLEVTRIRQGPRWLLLNNARGSLYSTVLISMRRNQILHNSIRGSYATKANCIRQRWYLTHSSHHCMQLWRLMSSDLCLQKGAKVDEEKLHSTLIYHSTNKDQWSVATDYAMEPLPLTNAHFHHSVVGCNNHTLWRCIGWFTCMCNNIIALEWNWITILEVD